MTCCDIEHQRSSTCLLGLTTFPTCLPAAAVGRGGGRVALPACIQVPELHIPPPWRPSAQVDKCKGLPVTRASSWPFRRHSSPPTTTPKSQCSGAPTGPPRQRTNIPGREPRKVTSKRAWSSGPAIRYPDANWRCDCRGPFCFFTSRVWPQTWGMSAPWWLFWEFIQHLPERLLTEQEGPCACGMGQWGLGGSRWTPDNPNQALRPGASALLADGPERLQQGLTRVLNTQR